MRKGVGSDRDDNREVVEVWIHSITPTHILVSVDGNDKKSVWLPGSLVDTEDGGPFRRRSMTAILAPQWLLEREGLV